MDTDMSSSSDTAKAALQYGSGFIRHPITPERRQVQSESGNEDSILKESLTTPQIEKVNENESFNHKRILTIRDVPPDSKVSQAQIQSPDAKVSRAHISPEVEVSRAHESTFVGVPASAHRDLGTRAAPSTALPSTGDVCAFPKSPDITVS